MLRVIDIVGEMLAGVRERQSELNQRLTDLYWFLFRRVSEAKIHSDSAKLAEALRLLEYERQTWLAVCEKLGAETQDSPTPADRRDSSSSSTGLSLEA
jgi:flagellin-specific chaperone FliS